MVGAQTSLFGVGQDGRVYSAWWDGQWHEWVRIGSGVFNQLTPLATIAVDGAINLFGVGEDGGVYTAWSDDQWHEWTRVGSGVFNQGTPLGVASVGGGLNVFGVGEDGAVYSAWWDGQWHDWVRIGTGVFNQGTPIAAVSFGGGVNLFGVGQDGKVYSAWWDGAWHNWVQIGTGVFNQGTPIATMSLNPNSLGLYAIGEDGAAYSAWWNGSWNNWVRISSPFFSPPTPISVAALDPSHLNLFGVAIDGRVCSAWWDGQWHDWQRLATGSWVFPLNSPVAAVVPVPGQISTFSVDSEGAARATWWDGTWHDGARIGNGVFTQYTQLSAVVLQAQPASGAWCDFFDPPGSVGVAPTSYGLVTGFPRRAQLTFAWAAGATLPSPPFGTLNQPGNLDSALAQAFSVWSAAAPSIEARDISGQPGATPDVNVSPRGLNSSPQGLLRGQTSGDGTSVWFDNATSLWAETTARIPPRSPSNTFSLLRFAIHEFGHALGLLHSTNTSSIMFPFPAGETLSPEDVAAIRALYGWAVPTRQQGGTESAPALCACGPTLVMVWRGIGEDHNLWFATSGNGSNWSPQATVPGAASSHGPSLAWDGRLLWMVWKGVPDDDGLYFTTWDTNPGSNWSPVTSIGGVGSDTGPSIAVIGGVPTMAWKGVPGDSGIYFSTFGGGGWAPQNGIGGIGTSDRPAISTDPITGDPRLVWKGIADDYVLYTSTQRNGVFWEPQEQVAWVVLGNQQTGTVAVGHPGSEMGPGLTMSGGKLFMAWRGIGTDQRVWFTQAVPDPAVKGQSLVEWSTQANVGGAATSSSPAVQLFQGRVYLAWKGVQDDHAIYTTFV